MKKFKNFLLEGNMDTKDFEFKTDLHSNEIYFTNYGEEYDDIDKLSADVYWHIIFEWMGDAGIDYNIYVDKVELRYTTIKYIDDDEEETKEETLIIDNPDNIRINTDTIHKQIIVQEINVDGDIVEVVF